MLLVPAACNPTPVPPAGAPPAGVPASAPAVPGDPVIARVNGLPILRSDLLDGVRSGRLGGSPELVFDELVGLTLVLKECEVMAGPAACAGPGTVLDRARPFLDRLFSPERSCGTVRDADYAMVYDRLAGRRIPAGADPHAPDVRLAVEAMVCKGRTTKAQRAYVTGLRQTARLDTFPAELDSAMKSAAELRPDPGPALPVPEPEPEPVPGSGPRPSGSVAPAARFP